MAFTQADIDTLDMAIKSGELRVHFADGREILYRSVDELMRARALMQGEAGTPSGTKRVRQLRMYSDKGF